MSKKHKPRAASSFAKALAETDFTAIDANRKMREARASAERHKETADKYHEQLLRVEQQLEIFYACDSPKYKIKLDKYFSAKPSGTATAMFSWNDWHLEERVDSETVNGMNSYNLEIADKRLKRLWSKSLLLTNAARKISNIRDAVVWMGGDLLNNQLHEDAAETNFLGPTEAILWVIERAEYGLRYLLEYGDFERILVATNHGNHGRTTDKMRTATAYKHSWEWCAYNILARIFANEPRITFKIAKGYHNIFEVQGHVVRAHHGEAIKFGGGVGGVAIPLLKAIAQWNKQRPAAIDLLGHFHQFIWNWHFVLSGCVVGFDDFANKIKAEPQPPTQAFIVMDRDRRVVEAKPIFVE